MRKWSVNRRDTLAPGTGEAQMGGVGCERGWNQNKQVGKALPIRRTLAICTGVPQIPSPGPGLGLGRAHARPGW